MNSLSRKDFLRSILLGASSAAFAGAAVAGEPGPLDEGNLRAFVELARSDIATQKTYLISQNIELTDDEALDFWPLQREYELKRNEILDRRFVLVRDFVKREGAFSDKEAKELAKEFFDIEEDTTRLKKRYYKRFSRVISPVKAVRFFQIENQLQMVIDLKIAASLPLIK